MRRHTHHSLVFVAALACLAAQPAISQTARSGGGGAANAQLLQQVQQLASERTAMQAEQARMKKELEALRKERDTLKAGQEAANQRARAATEAALVRGTRDKEAAEAELTKTNQRMQELVTKFRETAQVLREVETDRATAKQAVERHIQELNACVASNMAMYKLNDELLTRMDQQGFWSRVATAEPFTRLKRVELDNLIEEYRVRAEDQKISSSASGPTTVAPAPH
jgi:chromosome segregation ATPase